MGANESRQRYQAAQHKKGTRKKGPRPKNDALPKPPVMTAVKQTPRHQIDAKRFVPRLSESIAESLTDSENDAELANMNDDSKWTEEYVRKMVAEFLHEMKLGSLFANQIEGLPTSDLVILAKRYEAMRYTDETHPEYWVKVLKFMSISSDEGIDIAYANVLNLHSAIQSSPSEWVQRFTETGGVKALLAATQRGLACYDDMAEEDDTLHYPTMPMVRVTGLGEENNETASNLKRRFQPQNDVGTSTISTQNNSIITLASPNDFFFKPRMDKIEELVLYCLSCLKRLMGSELDDLDFVLSNVPDLGRLLFKLTSADSFEIKTEIIRMISVFAATSHDPDFVNQIPPRSVIAIMGELDLDTDIELAIDVVVMVNALISCVLNMTMRLAYRMSMEDNGLLEAFAKYQAWIDDYLEEVRDEYELMHDDVDIQTINVLSANIDCYFAHKSTDEQIENLKHVDVSDVSEVMDALQTSAQMFGKRVDLHALLVSILKLTAEGHTLRSLFYNVESLLSGKQVVFQDLDVPLPPSVAHAQQRATVAPEAAVSTTSTDASNAQPFSNVKSQVPADDAVVESKDTRDETSIENKRIKLALALVADSDDEDDAERELVAVASPMSGSQPIAPHMAAPPPPPAPAPPAAGFGTPSKARKLRQVHWKKIEQRVAKHSIWGEMENWETVCERLDKPDTDKFFAVTKAKKAVMDDTRGAPARCLLAEKRHRQVDLVMYRLKLDVSAIKTAILEGDEEAIPSEMIGQLKKCLPTSDEIKAIKGYKGDTALLSKADHIMIMFLSIPKLELRLDVWNFKVKSDELFTDLREQIETIIDCTTILYESRPLRIILSSILALGNYLNDGTAKGNAAGFELDSMDIIANIRSFDGKLTLLDFIVDWLYKIYPDIPGEFLRHMSVLGSAVNVPHQVVESHVKELQQNLRDTQELCAYLKQTASPEQQELARLFLEFEAGAFKQMQEIEQLYDAGEKLALKLNKKFVLDTTNFSWDTLFTKLSHFSRMFRHADDKLVRRLESEARKSKIEAQKEARRKLKEQESAPTTKEQRRKKKTAGQETFVDDAFNRLKQMPAQKAGPASGAELGRQFVVQNAGRVGLLSKRYKERQKKLLQGSSLNDNVRAEMFSDSLQGILDSNLQSVQDYSECSELSESIITANNVGAIN